MPLPIIIGLYAAAGALATAGAGGAHVLIKRARQDAAREAASRDVQHLKALLRDQLDLAELRAQAEELGVDVDAVIRGYNRLQSDVPSLDGLLRAFQQEGLEVPSAQPELAAGKMADENTSTATPAEIRQWAVRNGYEVAARGPLPNAVKDAYWSTR